MIYLPARAARAVSFYALKPEGLYHKKKET
jgi:hypothetical protein